MTNESKLMLGDPVAYLLTQKAKLGIKDTDNVHGETGRAMDI